MTVRPFSRIPLLLLTLLPAVAGCRQTSPTDSGKVGTDTADSGTDTADTDTDDSGGCDDSSSYESFYRDADGDGFGDPAKGTTDCAVPEGYVDNAADCDDAEAEVNPDAIEVCNGIDDDCDGADLANLVTDGDFELTAAGTPVVSIGGCWSGDGDLTVTGGAAESGAQSLASAGSLTATTYCTDPGFEADFTMTWWIWDSGDVQNVVLFADDGGYQPDGDILDVGYHEACAPGELCAIEAASGTVYSLGARSVGSWVQLSASATYTSSSTIDWTVCTGATCQTIPTADGAVKAFRFHSDASESYWDDMKACPG